MRYYFDTCIWIDYLNERDKRVVDFVFKIIFEHDILMSDVVFRELHKFMFNLFLPNIKNIILIKASDDEKRSALEISRQRNLPFADALHAMLARDNDAILVTRDKHFLDLEDICNIKLL